MVNTKVHLEEPESFERSPKVTPKEDPEVTKIPTGPEVTPPLAKKKAELANLKPRIECIDGSRFALVVPIIVGHFVKFATDNKTLLKLLTQENVLVGGFFIISGYVSAYTTTKIRECAHEEKKLAQPERFFWQKLMGYYPLHVLVSTVASPMFIMIDRWAKVSWRTTAFHALLNYSLMQAWFPSDAEIWNPPTWYLSSLTFANALLPTVILPQVARLTKNGLYKLLHWLTAVSLLQKLSYSQAWTFYCRGQLQQKTSSPLLWNVTRFHPFWAVIEITMGVVAARSVMLDDAVDGSKQKATNPLWYFIGSYATLALRITRFNFNDAIIRSLAFVPLYIRFLTSMHRDALSSSPHLITRFFGSRTVAWLGSLAFPMFVVHGPIGQLFYKKMVATRLWGQVLPKRFFAIYLSIVFIVSHLLNEFFLKSKAVQRGSGALVDVLSRVTEGMLHDHSIQNGQGKK